MIDFSKKIQNSNKFRQPALQFIKTGQYCLYPKGTSEYMSFWTTEQDRCINGYTADDGDFISGYNYFYLNYCPINRQVNTVINDQVITTQEVTFPDFWDYDYYYFNCVDEAQKQGKHLCVLKSRRKGYSYKGSAMLCRNYFLIPNSKSYVYASSKQYLTDDGILTKAWDYLDFIDDNTAWSKKRSANTQLRKRAAMLVTDEYGNKIEVGYKSEIIGVTLKDNPDIVRGKKANLILFEEAGSFKELGAAWQIARPSVESDGKAFATMIAFGTGGDEDSNFATLKNMFYKPKGFNCLELENIWDENVDNTSCGFFIPQYTNMDIRDDNGNRMYMDKDGNTIVNKALELVLAQRKEVIDNATSSVTVDRYVAERCITPAEACLEFNGNIFPKKELQEQLAKIRTNKKLTNHKQIGDLTWQTDGTLKWSVKKTGDVSSYHLGKNDDPTGAIVIWEHPVQDAPFGLYALGCLTPGEKVITDKGLINVEDVTLNEKLINKDGSYSDIINLQRYNKVNEFVRTVKVSNTYRTTTFTQEHPIYVSNSYYKSNRTFDVDKFNFHFQKTKDITKGQWIKYPNLYKPCNKGIDIGFGEDIWWLIGLWLGDGWCDNTYRISFALNSLELSTINKLRKIIKTQFNKTPLLRIRDGVTEVSFSCREFNDLLTSTFGKYANGKYIPEYIKRNLTEQNIIDLLLGYLDSDGCITHHTKGYISTEFVSINLELLESIQDLLFGIGIISNLSKMHDAKKSQMFGRTCKVQAKYHLRLGHSDSIKFILLYNGMSDNCKLNRVDLNNIKQVRARAKQGCFLSNDLDYIYFQIKEIQDDFYTGVVYNFECDTHTFLTHHITTHNCDPYDHDQSGTNSLGSTFVYKRFQGFESYYDIIVAEYTGRPSTAEEYYENLRKLAIYYNGRIMYENERKGLFPYFTAKHCDYLLADQPDIISDVVGNSKVQRKKGCHMNKQIKQWGEGLIKDWLNEERSPGHKNLHEILSEPLLEELIAYNDTGNFDRVMALMQVMIYREQLYNIVVKEKKKSNRERLLFDGPLFSTEVYYDDSAFHVEEDVYTFN